MRIRKVSSIFSLVLLIISNSFAQNKLLILCSNGTQSNYTEVFADDFESPTLDDKKWRNDFPWGRHLVSDDRDAESQEYYTDGKNILLNRGTLVLSARKERTCGIIQQWEDSTVMLKGHSRNLSCYDYSSGMIFSKEKYGFGFYDIRFKQSAQSKGLWPAFWLFNDDELDIFENKGERPDETHWDLHCKDGCKKKYGGWVKVKTDFTKNFNNISFNWEPEKQQWFCNGSNYKTAKQPFNALMHVIANNAVSKDRKGKGFWVGPDHTTQFPATLEIDYIRYFKKIYADRKCYSGKEDEIAREFASSKSGLKIRTKKPKKKNDQLLSIYINEQEHRISVYYYGKKSPVSVSIYNTNGKRIKEQKITVSNEKFLIDGLPAESFIVIAKVGKNILADRIETRR